MTAPDAREQPATTTRATGTTFAVGQRVAANRDITNDMIVTGDDTIIVPKGAAGVVDGLSNKLMRQYDFDLEVGFDQYMALYVNSDWLALAEQDEVVSSREAVEHAVVERIISELEQQQSNYLTSAAEYETKFRATGHIIESSRYWEALHKAKAVGESIAAIRDLYIAPAPPSLDALAGTEPEHGLRLDTLHRPSGGGE